MEAVDLEKNISRKKNFKKDPKIEENAKEWIKCQSNPLYFIYNYVYIQETGGSVKLTSENLHPKMKRVVRSVYNYHHAILMASRQLGKSTVAACLIAWAMVFFPKNRAVILNMKKNAALENIDKIRFIIRNLPSWMVTNQPFKQKSEIQTYLNLFNDSKVEVFYPSTVHASDTLARSLTSPVLYIDEAAHIKDMHDIYGSAQQTLSRAREQARKNSYPFFTLITSTPFLRRAVIW